MSNVRMWVVCREAAFAVMAPRSGQTASGPLPDLRMNSIRRQLSGLLHRLVNGDCWMETRPSILACRNEDRLQRHTLA